MLPDALQYKPSQEFIGAVNNLNAGLTQAVEMAEKPLMANAVLKDVTLPLFNLLSNYIKVSQHDTFSYFMGMFQFLYEQQATAADDNIVLAVDPDLADNVVQTVETTLKSMEQFVAFVEKIQAYLKANKPEVYEGKDKDKKKKNEDAIETTTGLREEALQLLAGMRATMDDLGAMADDVDQAAYDPGDEGEDEGEDESVEDEVALPYQQDDAQPYQSIIGE